MATMYITNVIVKAEEYIELIINYLLVLKMKNPNDMQEMLTLLHKSL